MSQPANSSAEVHAFPRRHGFNAFEQAKQELAAFKFSLFETVAADPLLRAGQCLNLIIVYASLVTIDKKTLQATPAYASNGRVFVRAGVRSHHTAVKARRLLEQHGYLIPVRRRNGITVYRIENPHHERVQMQIQELEECQREIKTEKMYAISRNPAWQIMPTLTVQGWQKMPTLKIVRMAIIAHQGWQKVPTKVGRKCHQLP
ncbi:hypothetical protein L263_00268 [Brucella abortus 90-0962]|uniref:hypothetical protein n=1 Tax=Brucella abortus TaxID=235 RepID=UPI000347B633|nr:hypothetical protein [Brucella abortus]EPG11713.1 hypothetical protein L263_00268 [Brucella abortus 90-0962]